MYPLCIGVLFSKFLSWFNFPSDSAFSSSHPDVVLCGVTRGKKRLTSLFFSFLQIEETVSKSYKTLQDRRADEFKVQFARCSLGCAD